MRKLSELLRHLESDFLAIRWAEAYDDPQAAWETCPRADWMLWLLPHDLSDEETRDARLMACDFAERALHLVPDGEDRPARAIEVARRYALGQATEEELREAKQGASDANDASFGTDWPASAAKAAATVDIRHAVNFAAFCAEVAASPPYTAKDVGAERAAQAAIIRRYWPTPPSSIMRQVFGQGVTQ